MRYGSLVAITGPMFAGKTSELIKEILYRSYFSKEEREAVRVFKLSVDTRYDEACIVSHDGERVDAVSVSSVAEIDWKHMSFVFLDEIQFFSEPYFHGDIMDLVRDMRMAGVDVICSGLDTDYLGRAFEVAAMMMAEASEVRRLSASCALCAAPASRTSRIDIGSDRFIPGAAETYTPLCLTHWAEDLVRRHGEGET